MFLECWLHSRQTQLTASTFLHAKHGCAATAGDNADLADLSTLFKSLDTDKNGTVSKAEWAAEVFKSKDMLQKYFGGASLMQIKRAFVRIDTNDDEKLTWEEFVAAGKGTCLLARTV